MPHRTFPGLMKSRVYRWYDRKRGFVGYVVMFALVAAALLIVQIRAIDAHNDAKDAQAAADRAKAAAEVAEREAERAERNALHVRLIACKTAKLVSFVPALQFEGEPRSNFISWILARRSLLLVIQLTNACSDKTTAILANRVRLDELALTELGVEIPMGGGGFGGTGDGGGLPGGQEPPAEQGVLDPIIDPIAPGADCDVTIEDTILCTEPDQ